MYHLSDAQFLVRLLAIWAGSLTFVACLLVSIAGCSPAVQETDPLELGEAGDLCSPSEPCAEGLECRPYCSPAPCDVATSGEWICK
jgi:hypothetical protein